MRPLLPVLVRNRGFEYIDLSGTFAASCGESVLHKHPPQRTSPPSHHGQGWSTSYTSPMKSAPKPCNKPGCGVLVRDGSARCDKHKPEAWTKKPTATKRITGRKLQAMRAELFTSKPLCAECERQGRVRLATQRDHIKPLAEGGADDGDNVQVHSFPTRRSSESEERRVGKGVYL